MKKTIYSLIITFIIGFVLFYFMLPPLNLHSLLFWFYTIILIVIFVTCKLVFIGILVAKSGIYLKEVPSIIFKGACLVVVIILGIIFTDFVLSPVFNSKSYAKRITIEDNELFEDNIKEVDFESLPLLDKASSTKLGDRVMGRLPELVSQFYVSDLYTQINYKNKIVRVTPLEYNGLFKFISNYKEGVKGYIIVNSYDGKAELIKLDKGMKYMDSAIFNKDLSRHLRFKYPTRIFGDKSFEIDDDGNPYWIIPTIKYVGVGLKREVASVIILDPITGDSKEYKVNDVPKWVDHVYSADLIIEQVDDWGQYKKGFFNSIFGQKGVVNTTDGYNYLSADDDVYLYTGITSVANDEANIGFILTNMRTKQTNFYPIAGAEEYSAMDSAKGQVQQMNYEATFPLLINLNNKPTYLLSLKDDAGLVKMYAFVDVTDYQKVVITDASKGIKKASENYLNNIDFNDSDTLESKDIKVSSINLANIDGNTYYYITDSDNNKYKVSIKVNSDILPFIKENDELVIKYNKIKDVTEIKSITLK